MRKEDEMTFEAMGKYIKKEVIDRMKSACGLGGALCIPPTGDDKTFSHEGKTIRYTPPSCLNSDDLLSTQIWANNLYGNAQFCDDRLRQRAVIIASALAANPTAAFSQAFGNSGQAKAAYSFVGNERVKEAHLILPTLEQTARDCVGRSSVLLIQDTTTVVSSQPQHRDKMGSVNQTKSVGILLHTCLATTQEGMAIGIASASMKTRNKSKKKTKQEKSADQRKPIEEKESMRWLDSAIEAHEAIVAQCAPGNVPRMIHVCDREGDIHEFFEKILEMGDGLVVRSNYNRRVLVGDELTTVQAALDKILPMACLELEVPRSAGKPARTAIVEARALRLKITPSPSSPRAKSRSPIDLNLVEIREMNPPDGCEAIRWRLWTTECVDTIEDVLAVVDIYKKRWRIEDMHLTLKSGCRVEKVQFKEVDTIKKVLALYLPISVRLLQLRDVARLEPDAPCTRVLSEIEWRVLCSLIQKSPKMNQKPPTMQQAVGFIGRLGGHLGRKSDGPPGVRTLWTGFQVLQIAVRGVQCFFRDQFATV